MGWRRLAVCQASSRLRAAGADLRHGPIDAGAADAEPPSDFGRASFRKRSADRFGVDRRRAALVDACGLGLSDALGLPLAPQVRLELGEHAEHV